MQIHEKQDFSLLVKKPGEGKSSVSEISDQWLALNNEHFKRFGMTEGFKDYMEAVKKLTIMICEHAIKPDPAKHIRIQLLDAKLQKYAEKTTSVNFFKTTANLSKFVGHHIDVHKVSVSEYYYNVQMLDEAVKHQQAQDRKNGKKGKL